VDDVPINIQLVASILSTEPYDLAFANSGKDALGQISETDFDLILLDIMMPELDGLAVARRLKSNPLTARIPIIFLTAKSDSESMTQSFEVGAADYLTKPFSPAELLSRVKTHVALKVYEDALRQSNIELAEAIRISHGEK
jgi:CheY-like chemotaxis protein